MAYKILKQVNPGETGLSEPGRTINRTLARGTESILGGPGNVGAGFRSAVDLLPSILPQLSPSLQKLQAGALTPSGGGYAQLPTSEQLKENVTKRLTGQTLEPQSDTERFYDDVVSDAAPIFASYLMGLGPLKGSIDITKAIGKSALKSLGVSGLGNTAKLATETLTGSPLAGAVAKLGTMLLAGTYGTRGSMEKLQKSSYDDAFSNIPLRPRFNFQPEYKAIERAIKKVDRSDILNKQDVLDRFNAFKNIVRPNTGRADVKEVVDMKRAWNDFLRRNGRNLGNDARRAIETARDKLKTGIERYGKTNPKFWKPYSAGEEITAGLRDIDEVSSFIDKYPYLKKKLESPILGSLFKGTAFHSGGKLLQDYPAQVAGGIGAVLGVQSGAKAIKLMANSPIAFKAYRDAVKSALVLNAPGVGRNLDKIEKEYKKQFSNQKGRFRIKKV